MSLKVVCLLVLVIYAVTAKHAQSSQYIHKHVGHPHEIHHKDHHGHHDVDYYADPKYEFEYKVDDDHSGYYKERQEHRDGHDTKSDYKVKVEHIVPHHYHHSGDHHHHY